jgi:hypothetical protein
MIPMPMEVVQERHLLNDMFGEVEEVGESFHLITAHFLAR